MRGPFAALDRYNQRAVEWQNARQAHHGNDLASSLRGGSKTFIVVAALFAILKLLLEDALGGWPWAVLLIVGAVLSFALLVADDRRKRRSWERSKKKNTSTASESQQ